MIFGFFFFFRFSRLPRLHPLAPAFFFFFFFLFCFFFRIHHTPAPLEACPACRRPFPRFFFWSLVASGFLFAGLPPLPCSTSRRGRRRTGSSGRRLFPRSCRSARRGKISFRSFLWATGVGRRLLPPPQRSEEDFQHDFPPSVSASSIATMPPASPPLNPSPLRYPSPTPSACPHVGPILFDGPFGRAGRNQAAEAPQVLDPLSMRTGPSTAASGAPWGRRTSSLIARFLRGRGRSPLGSALRITT